MNILSSVFNKNMIVYGGEEEENNLFSGFRKEDILPGTIITVPVLYLYNTVFIILIYLAN